MIRITTLFLRTDTEMKKQKKMRKIKSGLLNPILVAAILLFVIVILSFNFKMQYQKGVAAPEKISMPAPAQKTIANTEVDKNTGKIKSEFYGTTEKEQDISKMLGEKDGYAKIPGNVLVEKSKQGVLTLDFKEGGEATIGNIKVTASKGAVFQFIKEKGLMSLSQGDITIAGIAYSNTKGAEYEVDEKGKILKAKLTSTAQTTYIFGGESISVGPETEIIYQDGVITFPGKDKTIQFGKLNIDLRAENTEIDTRSGEIKGKHVKIRDVELYGDYEREGAKHTGIAWAKLTDKGIVVKNGAAEKEKIRVYAGLLNEILLANPDADVTDYKGNWIKIAKDSLGAKSVEGSKLDFDALPGNELFSMITRKYEKTDVGNFVKDENGKFKFAIVPDEKDNLKVSLSGGDGLNVLSRKEEGKIPTVLHKSSGEGKTVIEDGRLTFSFDKNGYSMAPPKKLDLSPESKQEGVAFQIASDTAKFDEEIRISSSNRFAILTPNQKERVAFTKENLKVSDLIADNELNIGQLQEKYPNINFVEGMHDIKGRLISPFKTSPHMVQLVDQWLSENKEAASIYSTIVFDDEFNARASYRGIEGGYVLGLGEKAFDIYGEKIRDNTPFAIMDHEYDHTKNKIIELEESKKLKELGKPEINVRGEEIKLLEEKQEDFYKKLDVGLLTSKQIITNPLPREISEKKEEFEKMLSKNPETKRLQHFYNEIVVDAANKIMINEKENLQSIREKAIEEIAERAKNNYGIQITKEELLAIGPGNQEINERIFDIFQAKSQELKASSVEQSSKVDNLFYKMYEIANFLHPSSLDKTVAEGKSTQLYDYEQTLKNLGLNEIASELGQLAEKHGLPASYAMHNAEKTQEGKEYSAVFAELSATYKEKPIEIRKQKVNSKNKDESMIYTKLTQLAFDSGMPVEEYKELMGEGWCKYPDCRDKKCILYKLGCEK